MPSAVLRKRTLLVGFDSAWTPHNRGAVAAVVVDSDGRRIEVALPRTASYSEAEAAIFEWQAEWRPDQTFILLDQPTVVTNAAGQRPVDNIVCSLVSARLGGMQPANTGKEEMFGESAPVRGFLNRFGGMTNPIAPGSVMTIETYPVLALIALGWTLPGLRTKGRLPKYNPARQKTFSRADWRFVCERRRRPSVRRPVSKSLPGPKRQPCWRNRERATRISLTPAFVYWSRFTMPRQRR